MWLIVGLGNPGVKYALNRHNIGFMTLDAWLQGLQGPSWSVDQDHRGLLARLSIDDEKVFFLKPQTYMNKSGESVRSVMDYFKIDADRLLVVQDDIDQSFGKMRFHKSRGHGGHNGIRNITEALGHDNYARLKLGVGRPENSNIQVADYVLQNFSDSEQAEIPALLNGACDAMECFIFEGLSKASTLFNK